jgi:hypothetical protein
MSHAPVLSEAANPLRNLSIPVELRAGTRWLAWSSVVGEGIPVKLPNGEWTKPLKKRAKPHKLPINPRTGGLAATTRATNWSSFEDALAAEKKWSLSGIGFVFDAADSRTGIDLDDCRDPQTGIIADWAWEIIRALDSYSEVSPSGTGVHIIIRGRLPDGKGRRKALAGGGIEMYSQGRYFTFTGNRVEGTPGDIRDGNSALLALHEKLFADKKTVDARVAVHHALPLIVGDDELIAKAMSARNGAKFGRLWNGQWEGEYPSQSEADLALCSHLAFWTRGDRAHMDTLFRGSGLMREKWERNDYSSETLDKAIAGTPQVWNPAGTLRGARPKGQKGNPMFNDEATQNGDPALGWERPVPFTQFDLPTFPETALPATLRDLVKAEASATQTPVDLSAMLVLSVVAAACARKVVIELKPGYREPVNIYTATALPSGNRKSSVFAEVTAPLREFERTEARHATAGIAKAKTAHKIKEARLRLRHSREMTQVCSPKVTHQDGSEIGPYRSGNGLAVTGFVRPRWNQGICAPSARMISSTPFVARGQKVFFGWVTLSEHKWVTFGERRGTSATSGASSRYRKGSCSFGDGGGGTGRGTRDYDPAPSALPDRR